MYDTHSVNITHRFFKAIDILITKKELRGIQTFTKLYDIDKRNLYKVKNAPENNQMRISWLYYLVNDFGVSADWLITGKGKVFK